MRGWFIVGDSIEVAGLEDEACLGWRVTLPAAATCSPGQWVTWGLPGSGTSLIVVCVELPI